MKIEKIRENVFSLTLASQELSALVASARMAVDALRSDPGAPSEAVALLERVLREYDSAIHRLQDADGRTKRPSAGSP